VRNGWTFTNMDKLAMTNSIKRFAMLLVAALCLAVASMPALAQELAPEHIALARKYLDLTDKAGLYETALVNTGVETMRTILTQNPDLGKPLDAAITKTLDGYKARKGELFDQFARIYAMRFTMEELQQIVDFYSSPVGVKLADANASLNNDMQTVMQVFEANLKVEFFAKVRAELKAAGYSV
jgi:uncharacterized protein